MSCGHAHVCARICTPYRLRKVTHATCATRRLTCLRRCASHHICVRVGLIARGYAHQPARVQGIASTVPNYGSAARLIQVCTCTCVCAAVVSYAHAINVASHDTCQTHVTCTCSWTYRHMHAHVTCQMTKLYLFSPSSGFYNVTHSNIMCMYVYVYVFVCEYAAWAYVVMCLAAGCRYVYVLTYITCTYMHIPMHMHAHTHVQCPLAMTDGAAKLLHSLLTNKQHMAQLSSQTQHVMRDTYAHLTSTDPAQFWTSGQVGTCTCTRICTYSIMRLSCQQHLSGLVHGHHHAHVSTSRVRWHDIMPCITSCHVISCYVFQWMTERAGGSDVGDGCMTLARVQPDGSVTWHVVACSMCMMRGDGDDII